MSDKLIKISKFSNKLQCFIKSVDEFYSKHEPLLTILSKIGDTIIILTFTFSLWMMSTESTGTSSSMIIIAFKLVVSIWLINSLINTWRKQNEDSKFLRNILSLTAIIVIVSFPFSYIVLMFGRGLSSEPGAQIGTADGWLAFIGSILGGAITMIALIFTIRHENRKMLKERDLRLQEIEYQAPPILICNFKENAQVLTSHFEKSTFDIFYEDQSAPLCTSLKVYLCNKTNTNITSIKLVNVEIFEYDEFAHGAFGKDNSIKQSDDLYIKVGETDISESDILIGGSTREINLEYKITRRLLADYTEPIILQVLTKMTFTYTSTLTSNINLLESTFLLGFQTIQPNLDHYGNAVDNLVSIHGSGLKNNHFIQVKKTPQR